MSELSRRAFSLFDQSDFAAAKALFTELCSDGVSSNAKFFLAQCELKLGENSEAIKHLKECVYTSGPPYTKAYGMLGELTGDVKFFRDGASLGDGACAYKYGVYFVQSKNVDLAKVWFDKCIRKQNQHRGNAYCELAILSLKSNDPNQLVKAGKYFVAASKEGCETADDFLQQISIHSEKELEMLPGSVPVNAALQLYREGDRNDAVKLLKKNDIPVQAAAVNHVLALIYLTLENYPFAFKCFEKSIIDKHEAACATIWQFQSFLA